MFAMIRAFVVSVITTIAFVWTVITSSVTGVYPCEVIPRVVAPIYSFPSTATRQIGSLSDVPRGANLPVGGFYHLGNGGYVLESDVISTCTPSRTPTPFVP